MFYFSFSRKKNREKKLIPKNWNFFNFFTFLYLFLRAPLLSQIFRHSNTLRRKYLLWKTTNNLSNVGKRRFSEKITNLRQVFEFGRVNYCGRKIFCRDVKTGFYVSRETFCECFWKKTIDEWKYFLRVWAKIFLILSRKNFGWEKIIR